MKENKEYTALDALKTELPEKYDPVDRPLKPNEFLKPGELEGPTGPRSRSSRLTEHDGLQTLSGPGRSSRQFDTGATRDTDVGKYDYEGFMSPLVQLRFGEYMHQHRKQSDGKLRDSDNWQKGIPLPQYIKSADRHVLDWRLIHREFSALARETLEDALCGILFNVQGYLHEVLKRRYKEKSRGNEKALA